MVCEIKNEISEPLNFSQETFLRTTIFTLFWKSCKKAENNFLKNNAKRNERMQSDILCAKRHVSVIYFINNFKTLYEKHYAILMFHLLI